MEREAKGMEEDFIGRQVAWGKGKSRAHDVTRLSY
jgi:hypothetical protein